MNKILRMMSKYFSGRLKFIVVFILFVTLICKLYDILDLYLILCGLILFLFVGSLKFSESRHGPSASNNVEQQVERPGEDQNNNVPVQFKTRSRRHSPKKPTKKFYYKANIVNGVLNGVYGHPIRGSTGGQWRFNYYTYDERNGFQIKSETRTCGGSSY